MENKEYVVLRTIVMPNKGKCFFTTNTGEGEKMCYGYTGEKWYEIMGYADTGDEAREMAEKYRYIPSMGEFEDWAKRNLTARIKDENGL